jgi:hypothetical protein
MDNITKWMVRGACGAVILSTGISFSYASYAVIRGKQLIRDAVVTRAIADRAGKCNRENFRFSYPEGSPKVDAAVTRCKVRLASSVPPWWTFQSPLEALLFP